MLESVFEDIKKTKKAESFIIDVGQQLKGVNSNNGDRTVS